MAIIQKTSQPKHPSKKTEAMDPLKKIKLSETAIKTPKAKKLQPQDKIFQDLEEMYHAAFEAKNFAVALRVLEIRGRQLGLFTDNKPTVAKSLQQMSKQELQVLLNDKE